MGRKSIDLSKSDWSDRDTIISPSQLADLLGLTVKTIYEWVARGRLDGACRKRGKHLLIMRDLALQLIFNGPEWQDEE